jgi:hypothetical protein
VSPRRGTERPVERHVLVHGCMCGSRHEARFAPRAARFIRVLVRSATATTGDLLVWNP